MARRSFNVLLYNRFKCTNNVDGIVCMYMQKNDKMGANTIRSALGSQTGTPTQSFANTILYLHYR